MVEDLKMFCAAYDSILVTFQSSILRVRASVTSAAGRFSSSKISLCMNE